MSPIHQSFGRQWFADRWHEVRTWQPVFRPRALLNAIARIGHSGWPSSSRSSPSSSARPWQKPKRMRFGTRGHCCSWAALAWSPTGWDLRKDFNRKSLWESTRSFFVDVTASFRPARDTLIEPITGTGRSSGSAQMHGTGTAGRTSLENRVAKLEARLEDLTVKLDTRSQELRRRFKRQRERRRRKRARFGPRRRVSRPNWTRCQSAACRWNGLGCSGSCLARSARASRSF